MRMLLALVATLFSVGLHAQESRTVQLKVLSAIDGNTIAGTYKDESGTSHGEQFRLFGISAPIKDEDKCLEQPYWQESKEYLSKIAGLRVKATSTSIGEEEYWRIFLQNGRDINLEMVKSGHAWHQPRHGELPAYINAQQEAKKNKRGLWGLPEPPVAQWKKAEVLASVFDFYGGEEKVKKLQRAKISLSVTAPAKEAGKPIEVLLDLPERIALIVDGDNVISFIKGDQRFLGQDAVVFGEGGFPIGEQMRKLLGRVEVALFSPTHDHLVLGTSSVAEKVQTLEFLPFDRDAKMFLKEMNLLKGESFSSLSLTLHVAESGEIVAFDVGGVGQSTFAFLDPEIYKKSPKSQEGGLVEVKIHPLTDKDKARFNPPEEGAVDAVAEKAD